MTKTELKEYIRKVIREHLNSEQIFRSSDRRNSTSFDDEDDEGESDVVFYNSTKNDDKEKTDR